MDPKPKKQKKYFHQKKSKKTCILWALHDLLVLPCSGWVPVLVSLFLSSSFLKKRVLFHHGFPGSSSFWRGFRCLSPFFSLLLFSRKGFCSIVDFLVPPASGWGSGVSPSFLFFFSEDRSVPDSSMNFDLHMTLVETCDVAVWGLCWCNLM